jgi:hypothetical protein
VGHLSGACPSLRFEVAGTQVVTNDRTNFRRGSCRDVRNKLRVEVIGVRLSGGAVEAREVELSDDDEDDSGLF